MRYAPWWTVFLDVGGVLLLPDHGVVLGALGSVGVVVDPGELDRAHYVALVADDWGPAMAPGFAVRPYWVEYAKALGVPTRLVGRAAAALDGRQDEVSVFRRPIPGCGREPRTLADRGVGLALISNTEHGHVEGTLAALGICQLGAGSGVQVLAVIDSFYAGVSKPDPAIFRLAVERAGADPTRSLHVGDSVRADVEGARAAGLSAIHFDPYDLCTNSDHLPVASLGQLAALVGDD
jgi:putative hydrolase of the HAD superfamily